MIQEAAQLNYFFCSISLFITNWLSRVFQEGLFDTILQDSLESAEDIFSKVHNSYLMKFHEYMKSNPCELMQVNT